MRLRPTLPLLLLALCATPAPLAARPDAGDDEYRFLVGLIDKGLYAMAVDEARSFLDDHPRHAKADLARYRLASALHELGRADEAAPHYAALAGRSGFEYRAECLYRSGQIALEAGRLREASAALEACLDAGQDYLHPAARFLLGECALQAGDWETATRRYEELLRRHPDAEAAAGARRGLAWCAWRRGDARRTVERAEEFLARHADDAAANEVRVLLGEALLEAGEPRRALEAYRAVRNGPSADAAARGVGFALAATGDHAGAANAFGQLVERFPESPYVGEARLQQGVQLLRAGDARAARRVLERASSSTDAGPESLFWLAEAQRAEEDFEVALRTLDAALAARPEAELAGRIQVARAEVLNRLGRTEAALAAYRDAGSDYALVAAAVAAWNGGDGREAARLAERALSDHPESAYRIEALLVLGEARFAAEDWDGARASFEAVLEGSADDAQAAQARARLGWCCYRTGRVEEGARRFEEVVRLHGDAAEAEEALYLVGLLRSELGDRDGAAGAWRDWLRRYDSGGRRDAVLFGLGQLDDGLDGRRSLERLASEGADPELVPRALLELAERSEADEDPGAARARYEDLLARFPESPEAPRARYGLGWNLQQAGEHAAAVEVLRPLTGQDVDPALRAAALELSLWALVDAGAAREATDAWRAFVRVCDDDERRFRATRRVADTLQEAGDPSAARALYDELRSGLRSRDVGVDVLIEGAYLALEEGDVDSAEAQVRVAHRQQEDSPRVAEASFFVGEARFEQGEDARAVELYRVAASEGSPVAADALYKLGFVGLRAGELEQARDALARLVDGHPESPLRGEAMFLLGEALFRQAQYERSATTLERLRAEAPGHDVIPKALFRLGLAYGHLERWPDAERTLAELARRAKDFPNLAEAELWRGRALAAQHESRSARQAFERVIALDQGELAAQARIGIGRVHEADGRTEEALSEYLKVSVLYAHPVHVPEALFLAGRCLERLGQTEQAVARYQELLDEHPQSRRCADAREALRRVQ